jgi:hypothetical protein
LFIRLELCVHSGFQLLDILVGLPLLLLLLDIGPFFFLHLYPLGL